jgi:hypothetical protein
MKTYPQRWLPFILALVLALAGCATPQPGGVGESAPPGVARGAEPSAPPAPTTAALDPALEARILALDPKRLSAKDVQTLAAGHAPRLILLHGGIYPVHLLMASFGSFLAQMGYPEAQIRDPGDGEWSYSPYDDSAQLAGIVAWHYERDGMRPMMIGHSQGGIQTVKVLRELAGKMSPSIVVWNPLTRNAEPRTTIVDPHTGKERPVVGLSLSYASAVGAGGAAFLLPNQWNMVGRLRSIPDSVDEFTGFTIGLDLIAWTAPGSEDNHYHPNGTAAVRNVELPATYNHITVPLTSDLPRDAEVRRWIEDWHPGSDADAGSLPFEAQQHVLWAADVWYSVKKHWCLEAQRLIRARRAAG